MDSVKKIQRYLVIMILHAMTLPFSTLIRGLEK